MKKLLFLILILSFVPLCVAQNTDSLYNAFLEIKLPVRFKYPAAASKDPEKYKCGFGVMADVKTNIDKFTPAQRNVIAAYSIRPVLDTSIVSPSGYFRIHYDTKLKNANGVSVDNRPAFDVNVLAAAADSAYALETGVMGFPAPPNDNGAGGDNKYDIYIVNIAGYYGFTEFDVMINENSYTSFMEIDNDFVGDFTTGIKAAKVTVAHEFHHAIQIGNYPYRGSDKWYHELTSTSMEEFVFSYVNDYYFYQTGYFDYPAKTISNHTGYDMAIFNLFLKERFGFPAIKRIWENITANRALKAISLTIEENHSTFKSEFSKFNTWTFFTGFRAIQGKYFSEAKNYPLLKPYMTLDFTAPSKTVMSLTEPVSNNVFLFVNRAVSRPDSIYAIVSNSDYIKGYEDPGNLTGCDYTLSSAPLPGSGQISPGYYVKLQSALIGLFSNASIVNNQLADESTPVIPAEIDGPFPQPFNYSRHSAVAIPAPKGESDESLLYIYTLNMKQVYSGSLKVFSSDKIYVRWNGLDDNNARLPNGVYFYVTKRDESIAKGKVVIQNE